VSTSQARFDRAPAEKNPVFPLGDAADHHFRILVMDGLAGVAHEAFVRVACRGAPAYERAALAAEFHDGILLF
jgi:hypothetical protein